MNNNCKYNKLCIDTDLTKLKEIRDYVYSASVEFGFRDDIASNIALAVDEACTNLIKYSFSYNIENKICLTIETAQKEFIIIISDKGHAFDPLSVVPPVMKEYFKNMKPGGLGIHIMRSIMDDISYIASTPENPFNILKLKKYLV